jgi:hypothetical protein
MHRGSCECSKTELDLFAMPPTLATMEDSTYIEYRPIAAITDHGPIEFFIPGNEERYLDLNETYLHIKAQIARADDGNFVAADQPAPDRPLPVNLWLHSLFSQVDISLNNTRVTSSTDTYPYRAVLETILGHDVAAKEHKLKSEMFYAEKAGKMETWDSVTNNARFVRCGTGQVVDMMGRFHAGIFHQEKYLINGVDLKLSMTRSKPVFNLMGTGGPYKVVITMAKVYVRQVHVGSKERNVIEARLNKGETAKYPIRRVLLTTFVVPAGSRTLNKDNLFVGGNQLPKRLIMGMVENEAFNGSLTKNPYNFKPFKLNKLEVFVNGKSALGQALEPNFVSGEYTRSYVCLLQALGKANSQEDVGIRLSDYANGHTLWGFDLTPDQGADEGHRHLVHSGSVRIDAHFAEALAAPVSVILYAEFDNTIEVTRDRQIILDY